MLLLILLTLSSLPVFVRALLLYPNGRWLIYADLVGYYNNSRCNSILLVVKTMIDGVGFGQPT